MEKNKIKEINLALHSRLVIVFIHKFYFIIVRQSLVTNLCNWKFWTFRSDIFHRAKKGSDIIINVSRDYKFIICLTKKLQSFVQSFLSTFCFFYLDFLFQRYYDKDASSGKMCSCRHPAVLALRNDVFFCKSSQAGGYKQMHLSCSFLLYA